MAIQTINIGNRVNDGLGDDLRTAFQKVNANFTDLTAGLTITASNIGDGVGIFNQKNGLDLEFKKLASGANILIEEFSDTIVINNTLPFSFVRIETDIGAIEASRDLINIGIQGSENINVRKTDDAVITIDTDLPVTQILTNTDFGFINNEFTNAIQLALSVANIDMGTVAKPGRISLDFGTF